MPAAIFPARRPLFYYITDRRSIPGKDLLDRIRRVIDWGADFVQIREKDLPDHDLLEVTARAVAIARGSRCRILVNGRADIAVAAGASGVHLTSTGLRPREIAPWVPGALLVGISAHSIREVVNASREGAHYVLLGPVYATPSKAAYGQPLGLPILRRACARVCLPVLGLGGIGVEQIDPVLRTGAAGIAGIRLFQNQLGDLGGNSTTLRRRVARL
jgi:thiamine-phosphate pyrophosphorylase